MITATEADTTRSASINTRPKLVEVWDPLVRFGHWTLVAAFAIAYFSAEEEAGGPDPLHVWGGYVVGGIVVLRVLWGLVGSRHARFSDFVCGAPEGPGISERLVARPGPSLSGTQPRRRCDGHCLAGRPRSDGGAGLFAYGEQGKGPLADRARLVTVANAKGNEAEHAARREGERTESTMGELHSLLANVTLALVVMHILGVALASFVHRENLVLSMISGRKRPEPAVEGK